jgi:hypothetical protein
MLPDDLQSLPYLVHTNRELGLMLRGVKPLALFSYTDGYEADCVLRYLRMFDRHVATGRFSKRETKRPFQKMPGHYHHSFLYTLPSEEWRATAMLDLLATPGAWSNERERQYGSLLGYEEWQNDVWLDRFPVVQLDNGS